ncbi:MAG TPA: PAS domain-containing sensor histidine kinase [Gammaproteobacteria bacterium]|nr:PAS domain-containing sensor histidine kinase [Gammaproteobacteria bacterium]
MWSVFSKHNRRDERAVAFTVAAVFVLSGLFWVLLTDFVLYAFTRDPVVVARVETAKGWTFVLLWAVVVYLAALRSTGRLARARAALAAVVGSIADGLLLLGRDQRVRHANPAAAKMLHCADLEGMDAREFVRRFRVSRLDGSLVPPDRLISQRVFKEGGPLHHKVTMHPSDSAELVVSVTAAAVRTEIDAPPEMVVSVMHDITDSEHLERLRDEFFTSVAHALKTPVAIIKASVQSLPVGAQHAGPDLIGVIERQCDRIDRLVRNMLVLARSRSRTLKIHPTDLALDALAGSIAERAEKTARKHDVVTQIVDRVRVHADGQWLDLALSDVIDSACRSSPAGSAVTVIVRRDGAGMAEIGVRHSPLPLEETTVHAEGEYDELGINRMVAETIVAAHGGTFHEDQTSAAANVWIRLPEARAS